MTTHGPTTTHDIELDVQAADIDAYGHVNNAVYLTWLDRAAWSHSAALGVSLQSEHDRGRCHATHGTKWLPSLSRRPVMNTGEVFDQVDDPPLAAPRHRRSGIDVTDGRGELPLQVCQQFQRVELIH